MHATELNKIFAAWCAEHTLAEVLAAFEKEGGTIAPIYSIDQVFSDPQIRARQAIAAVPDADFGTVRIQNVVPRFAADPCRIESTGGALGEHNAEIWGGWLGLSAEDQARLRATGVI